jgi:DNA-binding LacI/PurR family transcriptional regulator
VIEKLGKQGLRVPEHLSVLGIGGEEVAGLTAVQADWFGMGAYAVKLLLKASRGKGDAAPEHRLFPYQLRAGRTTAPPKG